MWDDLKLILVVRFYGLYSHIGQCDNVSGVNMKGLKIPSLKQGRSMGFNIIAIFVKLATVNKNRVENV